MAGVTRKLLLTAIGGLLGVGVALVAAELVYRARHGAFFFRGGSGLPADRADADAAPGGIFRQPPTLAGHRHPLIVTLGGSTTFGLGLAEADTWPRLLEGELAARGDAAVEVLNLAYLGGHLEQLGDNLARLSTRRVTRYDWLRGDRPAATDYLAFGVGDLAPDRILIAPIVNDTVPDFMMAPHWSDRACRALAGSPLRAAAVTYYVCRTAAARRSHGGARDPARRDAVLAGFDDRLRAFVRRLRATPGLAETPLALVTLPTLFRADESPADAGAAAARYFGRTTDAERQELVDQARYYPPLLDGEAAAMGRAARDLGIPLIDARTLFRDQPLRQRLPYFSDSIHTSESGSRAVAAFVAARLRGPLTASAAPRR